MKGEGWNLQGRSVAAATKSSSSSNFAVFDYENENADAAGGRVQFVSPSHRAWFSGAIYPGRRSPTRFALGYPILPFQGG